MKNLITLTLLMAFTSVIAQNQNSFPTSGNVGVNTQTPSAKLDVNGNMIVDSCLRIKDSLLVEKDMRGEGDLKVEGNSYFQGEVNIQSTLKVTGHSTFFDELSLPGTSLIGNNSIIGNHILIIDETSNEVRKTDAGGIRGVIYDPLPDAIACLPAALDNPFWVAGHAKLIPSCPEVNVGVGLIEPLARFHVAGTTWLNGLVGINVAPSGISKFHIKNQGGFSGLYIENDQSTVNTPSVGWYGLKISTTNPDIKAIGIIGDNGVDDVFRVMGDGTMWATEINVDVKEDFPDYVFSSGYNLICIDSVQTFVENEGHLPNMPSAEEVKEEGINIAEFEVQQTEKIEELYLYMFQMNQRLKELEAEVEILKEENIELKKENESIINRNEK